MDLQEESSKAVIIFLNQRQIGKTQLWAQGLNKWNCKDPQSYFNFARSLGKWQHFTHAFRSERMNIQFAFNPECSDGVCNCSGNDPCNSRAEICKPPPLANLFFLFLFYFLFVLFGLYCVVFFFLSLFLKAPLNCDWAGGVPNGTQHVGVVFFLGRWRALSLGASTGRCKVHWIYWRAHWVWAFRL